MIERGARSPCRSFAVAEDIPRIGTAPEFGPLPSTKGYGQLFDRCSGRHSSDSRLTLRSRPVKEKLPGSLSGLTALRSGGSDDSSTRGSPPTGRVTRLLDFLIAHPAESFPLSELARRLSINKATCLSVLNTLTSTGYVAREEATKRYRLGHMLLAAGHAAQHALSSLAAARVEMDRLSRELDVVTLAVARQAAHMTIIERIDPPHGSDDYVVVGQRVPFVAPFGVGFAAWLPEDERERWLRPDGQEPPPAQRARYDAVLTSVRERGYTVERLSQGAVRLGRALPELAEDVAAEERLRAMVDDLLNELQQRDYLPEELLRSPIPVSIIAGPIFGGDGVVELNLALHVARTMTPNEVQRYGQRLRSACDAAADAAQSHPGSGGVHSQSRSREETAS